MNTNMENNTLFLKKLVIYVARIVYHHAMDECDYYEFDIDKSEDDCGCHLNYSDAFDTLFDTVIKFMKNEQERDTHDHNIICKANKLQKICEKLSNSFKTLEKDLIEFTKIQHDDSILFLGEELFNFKNNKYNMICNDKHGNNKYEIMLNLSSNSNVITEEEFILQLKLHVNNDINKFYNVCKYVINYTPTRLSYTFNIYEYTLNDIPFDVDK